MHDTESFILHIVLMQIVIDTYQASTFEIKIKVYWFE